MNTRATGKSIWLEGFRRVWKLFTIVRGDAEGNNQLFQGPTESREPDGFVCHYLGSVIICFIISLYANYEQNCYT